LSKGLFITFEGIDGCGKTTQQNLLADFLREKGYNVLVTREPGAEKLGIKLREILLHFDGDVAPQSELFMYLADRAQHVAMVIKPAIEKGTIVLCDRHTDSALAYQGYARGLDLKKLKMLNDFAVNNVFPDLTLLYDLPVEIAQLRVGKEKDRLEAEGLSFFNKVRNGYLNLANSEPSRIKIIGSNCSVDTVFEQTKKLVLDVLE